MSVNLQCIYVYSPIGSLSCVFLYCLLVQVYTVHEKWGAWASISTDLLGILMCMLFLFNLEIWSPCYMQYVYFKFSSKCKNYNNILRIFPPPISAPHVGYEWKYMRKCTNMSVMSCVCVVCSSHSMSHVIHWKKRVQWLVCLLHSGQF